MNTHTRIYAILHGIRKAGGRPHKEKDNRMDQRAENELQHPPCKKTQMTHQSNLPNGLLQKNNQSHERIWKRIAMPWNKPLGVCSKALRNLEHMEKLLNCYENLYPLYCTVKGINKPYLTLPTLPRGLCH